MNGVAGPSSTFCSGRPLRLSSTGATHQHAVECRASVRVMSHVHASTSGRCWPAEAAGRSRARRVQVSAALFEPPPFQSSKLTVQYLPGAKASSWNSSSNGVSSSERITSSSSSTSWRNTPAARRYTLTHNDVTGALTLSIGADYNQRQVQGFYTRILRDEITAEWYFTAAGSGAGAASATVGASAVSGNGTSAAAGSAAAAAAAAPAELHIYCHVSGEERWLAPPQLRNFIFRREMTLVLDTFAYADMEFLQAFPDLMRAKVYVHFQSDVQDLDLREYWGVLGDRRSWRRMPRGVLARLKLLLFGFPAVPHQRPRSKLTRLQLLQRLQELQELQEQQRLQGPAPTAAAADSLAIQQQQQQQDVPIWVPLAESAVEARRSVASSLQEVRRLHPGAQQPVWQDLPQMPAQQQEQVQAQQQQQQQVQSSVEQQVDVQQQEQQQRRQLQLLQEAGQSSAVAAAAAAAGDSASAALATADGSSDSSSDGGGGTVAVDHSSNGASLSSNGNGRSSSSSSSNGVSMLDSPSNGNGRLHPPCVEATPQLEQQPVSGSSSCCVQDSLLQVAVASGEPFQEQQLQQSAAGVAQQEYTSRVTTLPQQQSLLGMLSSTGSSSSGNGALLPVLPNEGRLLQTTLQQQQQQRQGSGILAVPVVAGSTTVRPSHGLQRLS